MAQQVHNTLPLLWTIVAIILYAGPQSMKQFAYWYAYLDCQLLRPQPAPFPPLLHILCTAPAPSPSHCPLPQLRACFADIGQFIANEHNWQESGCTIDELNKMEVDIGSVLLLLQIEMRYMCEFWGLNRRIEASVTHLYAILQMFVRSLIPEESMTLFECKAAGKLCVSISNLQDLFKQIMKKINPICAFFSAPYFSEENELLRNFFENFVAFMKSIPKIKKSRMYHCSDLLKYILITNTLELTSLQFDFPARASRRTQGPTLAEPGLLEKRTRSCEKDQLSASTKSTQHSDRKYGSGCRSSSCYLNKSSPDQQHEDQQIKRITMSLRFVFPTWIRRHSIKLRKQSLPKIQVCRIPKTKSNTEALIQDFISESPRKIRNKSLTKYKLQHSPSVSSSQSPSKFRSLPPDKLYSYEKVLEEDEQNCFLVQKKIQKVHFVEREVLGLLEEGQAVVSLDTLGLEQSAAGPIVALMKSYVLLAELESIIGC